MTDKEKIKELEKSLASMKAQYAKLKSHCNALEQEVLLLTQEKQHQSE